jgi:hypothetical protein
MLLGGPASERVVERNRYAVALSGRQPLYPPSSADLAQPLLVLRHAPGVADFRHLHLADLRLG